MTNSEVKITVYIASHNYGHFLKDAIESVLNQSVENWEMILINDNSSDNTRELMDMYADHERIRVFHTDGIGLPSVANLALKHARGEYIVRLDGDDIFDENILLVLGNYLDKNQDTALVFPDYYLVDDDGGIFQSERRAKVFDENHMLDIPAHGACTMIRTDVLKELGGYRTDLGAQDGFDFWTKVLNRYKCGNVNVPLFYYRRHGKNLTSSSQRIFRARRAIKKDASAAIRQDEGRTIAVIPCRKYYDFTTDLWSKPLADNSGSLLDISIKRCLASDEIDLVIVSSDNLEVQSVVKQYQHPKLRFHQRQSKDTLRSRPISIAIKDMIRTFDLKDEDIIVLSYLQAPFTTIESLREAVDTMVMNEADSAFAIKEITDTVYQRTAHGLNSINYRGQLKADFDILYRDARVSTAFKVGNLKHGSINGSRRVHFVVPDAETHFMENKEDFNVARALFQIRKEEDQ